MAIRLHHIIRLVSFATLFIFGSSTANAAKIAIIGTGSVGGALGPEFAALGHDIVYGSRTPEREDVIALIKRTEGEPFATTPAEAVKGAKFVVLAVPGLMVEKITLSLGNLDGKIIIDPTNPLVGWQENHVRLKGNESSAETIQRAAPTAHVVKAFSTLNYQEMISPEKSGGPISIMLAGDDKAAKKEVAKLAKALGLEPIDVGPVQAARHLESMVILFLNNRIQGRTPFDFHLRKATHP